MTQLLSPASLFAVLFLAACGGNDGPYPALLPTDQILAEPVLPGHAGDAAQGPAAIDAEAAARAAELRRRAEALRGPVIDPAERARMEDATS